MLCDGMRGAGDAPRVEGGQRAVRFVRGVGRELREDDGAGHELDEHQRHLPYVRRWPRGVMPTLGWGQVRLRAQDDS